MLRSQTFDFQNFTALLSLGERQIFLKITDSINFSQYEAAFDSKEVRLNFDLAALYELLKKAFINEEGYNFNMSVQGNGSMKFQLSALVGGFLKVEFDVFLKEKVMSNDGQLTTTINRLEQQLVALNLKLKTGMETLEKAINAKDTENKNLIEKISSVRVPILKMWNHHTGQCTLLGSDSMKPMLTTSLDLQHNVNAGQQQIVFENICCFTKLDSLIIRTHYNQADFLCMQNDTVKQLELDLNGDSNSNPFVSIRGIDKFPNLRKLSISGAPRLKDIPTVLKSVENKIVEIEIRSCSQVNSIELQTYCQTNGIKLAIA
jgi:hypothetical protein